MEKIRSAKIKIELKSKNKIKINVKGGKYFLYFIYDQKGNSLSWA